MKELPSQHPPPPIKFGVWHHHKGGRYAPIKGERVRHDLWVLMEMIQDGRLKMRCLGEGELALVRSSADEILVTTPWLEVAGSRSSQICIGKVWSKEDRFRGSEAWSKEAHRSELGSLLWDARLGKGWSSRQIFEYDVNHQMKMVEQ